MKEDVTGLVVCGGKSTRMGEDKSMLDYHGVPQRYYLYDVLKVYCNEVYLSCNKEQATSLPPAYKAIVDDETTGDYGPLTGVLSAHNTFPSAHLLVVGCDYPLAGAYEFEGLTKAAGKRSVAFRNAAGSIEPMISFWSQQDLAILKEKHHHYNHSLRRFLEENNALILDHPFPGHLSSIDTLADYHRIKTQLRNRS